MSRITQITDRILDVVIDKEPARALGAVAAVLTAAAAILSKGDVHTWQAALPVLLAELIRRQVNSPETVTSLVEDLLGHDELTK